MLQRLKDIKDLIAIKLLNKIEEIYIIYSLKIDIYSSCAKNCSIILSFNLTTRLYL